MGQRLHNVRLPEQFLQSERFGPGALGPGPQGRRSLAAHPPGPGRLAAATHVGFAGPGRHRAPSRDLRCQTAARAVFGNLPPRRHRARHLPLHRTDHEFRRLLAGRACHHDHGPNGSRAGGSVSAQESRPAGTDCRNTRAIRGHRPSAGRRLAAVGGAPRRAAGADARFSLDGRPAFRPKRRGCLPQYVEAVVFLARIFRQFVP